jgi:hypothetical protein
MPKLSCPPRARRSAAFSTSSFDVPSTTTSWIRATWIGRGKPAPLTLTKPSPGATVIPRESSPARLG